MDPLLLARWESGTTTVYHFLFVPLTLGTALLTALLQTWWLRSGEERHLQAARFCGRLFLIGFALGVAAGLVQEFQSGLAWSGPSRFAGADLGTDPGAPSAVGGLLGFFLVATFLGVWICGRDRLPRFAHTGCIWIAVCGTAFSAAFGPAHDDRLLHPVGRIIDGGPPLAPLTGLRALLGDTTVRIAFAHTVTTALLLSGTVLAVGAAWHLRRGTHRESMLPSLRAGLCAIFLGGLGTAFGGAIAPHGRGIRRMIITVTPAVPHPMTGPMTGSVTDFMIGFGLLAAFTAAVGLWTTHSGFYRVAAWALPIGPIGASVARVLTETSRAPWAVPAHGLPMTKGSNSLAVSGGDVWTSLIMITALYALLAVVEVVLMLRAARRGPGDQRVENFGPAEGGVADPHLGFAY